MESIDESAALAILMGGERHIVALSRLILQDLRKEDLSAATETQFQEVIAGFLCRRA